MKAYPQIIILSAVVLLSAFVAGCEDDLGSNSNDRAIPLVAADGSSIKAAGHGQYRLPALSGTDVSVKALIPSSGVQSLTITKTVNLEVDDSFGNNGVLTVDPSSFDTEYTFNYSPPVSDIDQLVGFTFRAERSNGVADVSDLTLVVTLSPRDNIPFRRWNLVSRLWIDADNAEDLKECEKDNYYLFNSDGTMSLNYGANTGTGDCGFDGFNVYDTWELSEDGESFIMTRHSIFTPDVSETETYRVMLLTTDRMELEIDLDLSVFGLSSEETFRYIMEAAPR
jgi:hypothetical protein